MQEEIDMYMEMGKESMEKTIDHLQSELKKVRTGRASASMFSGLLVEYYGAQTPLPQLASVSVSDARTIAIQPFDKSMLSEIERAIFSANMGITPQNNGETIRINIPPLTEDRRRGIVKQVKALGEDAKVSIRSGRKELMDAIKKAVKDGYSEDAGKKSEADAQTMVTNFTAKVDKIIEIKEKEVMTV